MEQHQRAVSRQSVKPEVVNEASLTVGLYEKMLGLIDEVYKTALQVDNCPELATLLDGAGQLKVKLGEFVERLKEEERVRKASEELLKKEDKNG